MPMATIKVLEGVFSGDEKRRMIQKVTDAIVSCGGEAFRDHTLVILEEVESDMWAVGGATLSSEQARQLRAVPAR